VQTGGGGGYPSLSKNVVVRSTAKGPAITHSLDYHCDITGSYHWQEALVQVILFFKDTAWNELVMVKKCLCAIESAAFTSQIYCIIFALGLACLF
jgi:hypothetical protein